MGFLDTIFGGRTASTTQTPEDAARAAEDQRQRLGIDQKHAAEMWREGLKQRVRAGAQALLAALTAEDAATYLEDLARKVRSRDIEFNQRAASTSQANQANQAAQGWRS